MLAFGIHTGVSFGSIETWLEKLIDGGNRGKAGGLRSKKK